MRNNYICALDLGSSKISCALAAISRKGNISSLFLETITSRGIKNGKIQDPVDLSDCISKLLDRIKIISGINIKSIYINVYGYTIVTKQSHATIPLAERANKIITKRDLQRVEEEARILGSTLEEEIIHQMPVSFKVDDQEITNPLGLYGHRLEVDLRLVCVKSSYVQNISRLTSRIGYEIKQFFLSSIAISRVVFRSNYFRKGLNILCDIGGDTTQISIFKDGLLHNLQILPQGGDDLTAEISRCLKIPFELAEEIKKSYATVGEHKSQDNKEVMIKKETSYIHISRRQISETVTSKSKSLIQAIKNSVLKMTQDLDSIDSFLVGGRTVLLDGFLEMMEAEIGLPVKIIRFSNPEIIDDAKIEVIRNTTQFLNYATCLGAIYEARELRMRRQIFSPATSSNPLLKIIHHAKELYQEYF